MSVETFVVVGTLTGGAGMNNASRSALNSHYILQN